MWVATSNATTEECHVLTGSGGRMRGLPRREAAKEFPERMPLHSIACLQLLCTSVSWHSHC